jgi:hypothetical protein
LEGKEKEYCSVHEDSVEHDLALQLHIADTPLIVPLSLPTYHPLLAFPTGQSIIVGSVVDIQVNAEKTFAAVKLNDSRGESVILLVTGCLERMLSAVPHLASTHSEYSCAQGAGAGIVALVFQAHLLLESDPLVAMKGAKPGTWIPDSQCLTVFN